MKKVESLKFSSNVENGCFKYMTLKWTKKSDLDLDLGT